MNIQGGYIKYSLKDKELSCIFPVDKVFITENLSIYMETVKGNSGTRFSLIIEPKDEIIVRELYLEVPMKFSNDEKIYLNGFQTWTESKEYSIDERLPRLNRIAWPIMSEYGDYNIFGRNKDAELLHSFTYTYIKNGDENYRLYGSIGEENGYTIYQFDIENGKMRILKDCAGLKVRGKYIPFDIIEVSGRENEVFEEYFKFMPTAKPRVKPCTGWTSWYYHYTKITEGIIMENLKAFSSRRVPIDVFQIDDGYQNAVGDWLVVNKKFPKGMKYIADEIKSMGYSPGLWLAPFIAEKKSILLKEHPGWVKKDKNGRPLRAGYNPLWSGSFYAMDFYNQEFRDYLREVFDTVLNKWGFDMVKLDFLYGAALCSDENRTRGQVMREAMEFLREICGDKIILGCGVPLGPSFGLVDYCRIGSDVALKWEDKVFKAIKYRERVSTINSLTSTIGRRHLNGNTFLNDPDVFILRSEKNKLSKEQRHTLFLLNLIFGGLVFTSDNINNYSKEEMSLYNSIFPHREKIIDRVINNTGVYSIDFSIEDKTYRAFSNTQDDAANVRLERGLYFKNGTGIIRGDKTLSLKPYESICLLRIGSKEFEVAGSGHVFPGSDILSISLQDGNVQLELHKNVMTRDEIYIKIPDGTEGCRVNGKYYMAKRIHDINIIKVTYFTSLT